MSLLSRFHTPPAPAVPELSPVPEELDLKLQPHFNFKRGFFIEAGSRDDQTSSPTLYLEHRLGWRGLLVHSEPELAAQCRRNRPNCRVEHCVLASFETAALKVARNYANHRSLVGGTVTPAAPAQPSLSPDAQVQSLSSSEPAVPARTLTAVLHQHRCSAIDLLCLNVEGAELEILQGLDFEYYAPKFMLISTLSRAELDAFLQPCYEPIVTLSEREFLYRRKNLLRRSATLSPR